MSARSDRLTTVLPIWSSKDWPSLSMSGGYSNAKFLRPVVRLSPPFCIAGEHLTAVQLFVLQFTYRQKPYASGPIYNELI
jgi:hypothetical protein